MLLVSLFGLVIPVVTVASYSPTNVPETFDSGHTRSDQNSVRSEHSSGIKEIIEDSIEDRLEEEIGIGIGKLMIDSQLGSTHLPISPSACIACDPLGQGGRNAGLMRSENEAWMRSGDEVSWMRSEEEEVAEHRCPEWASAPPILDDATDGKCSFF